MDHHNCKKDAYNGYETLSEAQANCDPSENCVAVWDTKGAIWEGGFTYKWDKQNQQYRKVINVKWKCDNKLRFKLCPKSFRDYKEKHTCGEKLGKFVLYWKNDGRYM